MRRWQPLLSTDTWYHLALVSNNAATGPWKQRIYINGAPSAEAASPAPDLTSNFLVVGGNPNQADRTYYLDGYMSNVGIYRGYAKYDDAFTPDKTPDAACV